MRVFLKFWCPVSAAFCGVMFVGYVYLGSGNAAAIMGACFVVNAVCTLINWRSEE